METITHIMLEIFGNEYRIISYNINLSQNYNLHAGKASGRPVGNLLEISIISNHDSDFVEWMVEDNEEEDGSIEFYNGDDLIKSINFSGGILVGYNQNLDKVDIDGQNQRVVSEDLSIVYQELDIAGVPIKPTGSEA